jgi:deazaflavin-dependent oxidoreductase (nitroreductase family)
LYTEPSPAQPAKPLKRKPLGAYKIIHKHTIKIRKIMPEITRIYSPPRGLSRLFFRSPIWLFTKGLGWIFGERLLLLNHVGRKTGRKRQVVLEVAQHNKQTGSYIVNVGYGEKSDWYQNIKKTPNVSIIVGRRKLNANAEIVSPTEGGEIMLTFFREHPIEARMSSMLGYKVDGTEEDFRLLGEKLLFVKFVPKLE